MSKFSVPVLFFCSLAAGGVLFFFSLRSLPASGQGRFEGYAALALEETVPDREAAGVLEAALGRPVVSESSQWVLLNSFEGLEQVPLEDYQGRLEDFDPRRDGYAEKLMNFFIRDGRRWFFIPLDRKLFGSLPVLNPGEQLKKRIGAALDTVPRPPGEGPEASPGPFSLLIKPQVQPLGFRILLFVLAWTVALVFPPARRPAGLSRGGRFRRFRRFFRRPLTRIPPERRRLLLLAPLLFPLSLWGAPGFAFISLSLFLGTLLADPLKECWIRLLGKAGGRAGPYRFRFFYSLPPVLFLALIPWIGGMPPLGVSLNFLGFSLVYFSSLGLEIRRKFSFSPGGGKGSLYGPCRFVPLPILSPRLLANPFPSIGGGMRPRGEDSGKSGPGLQGFPFLGRGNGLVLPFVLASCLAAFSVSLGGDFRLSGPSPHWPSLVVEEDYRAHVLFQAGFAHRSLAGAAEEPGYLRYTLGEDGLVAGALPINPEGLEIPPFPLADLSRFLAAWDSGGQGGGGLEASLRPALRLADLVSPLLVFLLVFPSFAGRGRGGKKVPAYYDKRIAA